MDSKLDYASLQVGRIAKPPNRSSCSKPHFVAWAESFIFAGSSALLLLIANLFPHYWYVSFFALTPFLYRIIRITCGERSRTTPSESLRLGFLFGLSFFAVSLVDTRITSPFPSVLMLLFGTGLFALFGWAVGWARNRWGFYPSLVALLWVGVELGLVKLGMNQNGSYLSVASGIGIPEAEGQARFSHPLVVSEANLFFHALVGLFGFLTVSAIIVLFNSLLVLLFLKTLELTRPRGKTLQKEKKRKEKMGPFLHPLVFPSKSLPGPR